MTKQGEAIRFFQEVALTYEGTDCLTWPFCRNRDGYGIVWFDGKTRIVSRLACEQVNGPPPTPKHEAAHSCGNAGCVTPCHISWKTPLGNSSDKFAHGTVIAGEKHTHAKLSSDDVIKIRQLAKAGLPQSKIAARFPVTQSTVSLIVSRKRWASISEGVHP